MCRCVTFYILFKYICLYYFNLLLLFIMDYSIEIELNKGIIYILPLSSIEDFEINEKTIFVKANLLECEIEKTKELTEMFIDYFNPVNEN